MPWALRRRLVYLFGVFLFFAVLIGVPVAILSYRPPTCFDGIQNQGETAPDKGGPCTLLDERFMQAYNVLWSRSFPVRSGGYNAVAYVLNPNGDAGVRKVAYRFGLYDKDNVLVAEDTGTTYLMPGAVTPIFDGPIATGNRVVAHTQFSFIEPLVWEKVHSAVEGIAIDNKLTSDLDTMPRIAATVHNTVVTDVHDVTFVVTVYDTAGNAFAASKTLVPFLAAGEKTTITFTWPVAFTTTIGQVDILPLHSPVFSTSR